MEDKNAEHSKDLNSMEQDNVTDNSLEYNNSKQNSLEHNSIYDTGKTDHGASESTMPPCITASTPSTLPTTPTIPFLLIFDFIYCES